jgi:hypothetical protein
VWQIVDQKGMKQFQITLVINSDTLMEAVKKVEGIGEIISANARPPQQPVRTTFGIPQIATSPKQS